MRAIRQYEFGPAENLRYEEVPDPRPGPGQVRIAVAAAGVHLLDTSIRSGVHGGPFPLPDLPMTPGREVAGTVDAVGDGVEESWIGRRVVAHLGQASGGYAELAVREVEAVHPVPDGLADEAAVAMIGTGRTTVAILERTQITGDDVVLVTSAAGGIGTLLVQAAQRVGALVVGVVGSAAKVERAREQGAKIAVDYHDPDWTQQIRDQLDGRDLTVVLDGVGGDVGRGAFELLGPGGRIVMFGWSAGEPTQVTTADLYARSLTASVPLGAWVMRRLREFEEKSLAAAAAGDLAPAVQRFPLSDAAAAHTALEAGATTGKVVLIP